MLRNSVDGAKLQGRSLDVPQSTKDTMEGANTSKQITDKSVNDKLAHNVSLADGGKDHTVAVGTPADPAGYVAEQNLQTKQEADKNFREIQGIQFNIAQEFFDATSIQRRPRGSLYTMLINNAENHVI